MKQIQVHAKSGTDEPYLVTFIEDEGRVKILCSCPEGEQGLACEHKIRLAANDHNMLPTPVQMKDLNEAHIWVIQSPISDLILRLYGMHGEGEQHEKEVRALVEEIGIAMREGR